MARSLLLLFAFTTAFGFSQAAEPSLVISEFLAQNVSGLKDDRGEYSDWIEIHNPGFETVDLEGYYLTDSSEELTMWKFPKVMLRGKGYVLVFASGTGQAEAEAVDEPANPRARTIQRLRDAGLPEAFIDRVPAEQLEQFLRQMEGQRRRVRLPPRRERARALHANFKLGADGEYLALVRPDGETVVHAYAPEYPEQRAGVSYGTVAAVAGDIDDGAGLGYLVEPSPGRANAPELKGFVRSVFMSEEAGFFDEPFELQFSCATPGAEIRYTLDGGVPTPVTGLVYREPVTLRRTSIVRVAAFQEGYRASDVETRTFLFLDDVLSQSPEGESPPGWPGNFVNGQHLDYGMSSEIVGGLRTRDEGGCPQDR